jgi:hypothetical protein
MGLILMKLTAGLMDFFCFDGDFIGTCYWGFKKNGTKVFEFLWGFEPTSTELLIFFY